jgi:hypothetical protein
MKRFFLCGILLTLVFLGFTACSSTTSDDLLDQSAPPVGQDNTEGNPEYPWADYEGLRAGFGKTPILELHDDISGYWVAGFSIIRPATGIHDPIYSIAAILDDGKTRTGIVAVDAFSLSLEDSDAIRNDVCAEYGIDHLVVHSLHNHEVPDNNGLWSFLNILDVNSKERFVELIHKAAVKSIKEAVMNIEPAQMYLGEVLDKDILNLSDEERIKLNLRDKDKLIKPNDLGLSDLRPPFLTDNGLRFAVFKSPKDGHVIGTFVNWSNHVETIWKWNQDISADFAGYMRELLDKQLGGQTMFITGNTGNQSTYILDPVVFYDSDAGRYVVEDVSARVVHKGQEYWGKKYKYGEFNEENFIKAQAHGYVVADAVAEAVKDNLMEQSSDTLITFYTHRENIQIQSPKFIAAYLTGLLERKGTIKKGKLYSETEVGLLKIGDLWILTLPGELFPEIAVHGAYDPVEADYHDTLSADDRKLVDSPLRPMMKGKINMMMNLGNDHLGYFVPKSQWDEKEPYTFGNLKAPYGEENSIGPDAATTIYLWAVKLLEQAQK